MAAKLDTETARDERVATQATELVDKNASVPSESTTVHGGER
jgi:hypothetical protein